MDEDKSGLELAKSAFTLVKPNAGTSEQLWDAYTAERLAVQELFNTVLLSIEEENSDEENEHEVGKISHLLSPC
jgi:hypothetical protein